MKLEKSLRKGINAHKAGNLKKAYSFYEAVLKEAPDHPEANHNMGILARTSGKNTQATLFFKKAVEVRPDTAQY